MMTVKELSQLTGISVRTLHYYDEIGLFVPTTKSKAGYRLYDDKALEDLQQILFFREFEIPLRHIKAIMQNPTLDKQQILQIQRRMLLAKQERLGRLIAEIDNILKGDKRMDFTIFNKTEIEQMFQAMFEHLPEELRETAIKEFGNLEEWKQHYLDVVSSEKMQKNYAKVVEWYGGKESYLTAVQNPVSQRVAASYNKRLESILQKMIEKRAYPVSSFEIKQLVGEYGFVMKQLCQIKDEQEMMLSIARSYRNKLGQAAIDKQFGDGASEFFVQAIEEFYK